SGRHSTGSEACLAGGAQMLRSAVVFPGLTPRSPEPAFGRDDQAFRIRVERFGNEPLVDLRTVGVGGIDEGDAELDSTPQHALSTRTIKRFTPYTRAAQAHGAEPEAIHGGVATEGGCHQDNSSAAGSDSEWPFCVPV